MISSSIYQQLTLEIVGYRPLLEGETKYVRSVYLTVHLEESKVPLAKKDCICRSERRLNDQYTDGDLRALMVRMGAVKKKRKHLSSYQSFEKTSVGLSQEAKLTGILALPR